MSARAPPNAESTGSSSGNERVVQNIAPFRESGQKIKKWKPQSSNSEATRFASMFLLLNEYEFSESKRVAIVVAQAKQCSEKCIAEQSKCFEAIHSLCARQTCPEFAQTCCAILDLFTKCTSDSIGDYLRHSQWKMLSEIRPLDAFQETMVVKLAENISMLVQNHSIALQDLASRTLCRFIIYFYRSMSLYMFLLKEQEKEMRAKHLKSVLNQRRRGLRESLEMSIVPLFDPNFAASFKSEIVEGGYEFMLCINADEVSESVTTHISYFFHGWSRLISFKRLSVSAIVHSLMKLLLNFCNRWASHLSKSKLFARLWHKMCHFLVECSEQDRICAEHFVKTQKCIYNRVLQRWRQFKIISKQVAKSKICKMNGILLHWGRITKMRKRIVASRKVLTSCTFKLWRGFTCSKLKSTKLLEVWAAQLSAKLGCRALKSCFVGWKQWYLVRWIACTYLNKSRATRALSAWIQYQISFIEKMISCATRVRFLRDANCIAAHFLNWKLRAASKRNVEVTVAIQRVRIWLNIWSHKCGFGSFKNGSNMTCAIFCFNRWNKLSQALRTSRQELLRSLASSLMKTRRSAFFKAWENAVDMRCMLAKKALDLIIRQRLKPAVLHMLRNQNILQRIGVCINRSKHAAFLAWKALHLAHALFNIVLKRMTFNHWIKFLRRSRHSSLIVYKRNLFFFKRLFAQFRLRCKESSDSRGAEFKLRKLVKKFAIEEQRPGIFEQVPAALSHDKGALAIMNGCFRKWYAAMKDHNTMSFLEMMFRCGEKSVMRRHFNQWKRRQ